MWIARQKVMEGKAGEIANRKVHERRTMMIKDYSKRMTVKELMEKKQDLVVPDWHREKGIWTRRDKNQLVAAVMEGYPTASVLFALTIDGKHKGKTIIVDGVQRIDTICNFVGNAFRFQAKYLEHKYEAASTCDKMLFNELSHEQQEIILNYEFHVVTTIGGTDLRARQHYLIWNGAPEMAEFLGTSEDAPEREIELEYIV